MNLDESNDVLPPTTAENVSHDCIDVILSGPGDPNVRPLTGKMLEFALAQRAKITGLHESAESLPLEESGQEP